MNRMFRMEEKEHLFRTRLLTVSLLPHYVHSVHSVEESIAYRR